MKWNLEGLTASSANDVSDVEEITFSAHLVTSDIMSSCSICFVSFLKTIQTYCQ